jgi:hypothetical protein
MGVPVSLVPRGGIASCWPKVRWNLSTKASLWARKGMACHVYTQPLTHGGKHPGLKVPPLVTVSALWHSQSG